MNILFLDIDGVMNHRHGLTFPWKGETFHPAHIPHLKKILDNTDAMIVLSSTWRYGKSIEQIKEWFFSSGLDGNRVFDKTPTSEKNDGNLITIHMSRWDEIRTWLRSYREMVENYVILDDENLGLNPRHVKTDFETGLQEHHADRAIKILKNGR